MKGGGKVSPSLVGSGPEILFKNSPMNRFSESPSSSAAKVAALTPCVNSNLNKVYKICKMV